MFMTYFSFCSLSNVWLHGMYVYMFVFIPKSLLPYLIWGEESMMSLNQNINPFMSFRIHSGRVTFDSLNDHIGHLNEINYKRPLHFHELHSDVIYLMGTPTRSYYWNYWFRFSVVLRYVTATRFRLGNFVTSSFKARFMPHQ